MFSDYLDRERAREELDLRRQLRQQHRAVCVIQRIWRGHIAIQNAQRELEQRRFELWAFLDGRATAIQRVARGHLARVRVRDMLLVARRARVLALQDSSEMGAPFGLEGLEQGAVEELVQTGRDTGRDSGSHSAQSTHL